MIKINITGFLTDFTGGRSELTLDSAPATVGEALEKLWDLHVGLRDRVVNEQGELRQHVNIFLDNENIRRKQLLKTELANGSEITILPSVSGGESDTYPRGVAKGHAPDFVAAIRKGERTLVMEMLAGEPDLIRSRHEGGSPLHFAALENQREIVDLLLEQGADPEARDSEFNMTPIGWANEKGHRAMVEYLFARGVEVNLNRAAAYGLADRVRELLTEDASRINVADHYGTPLHEASLWGHVEMVELLLAHGADPALRNWEGQTAIEIATAQLENGCRATPIVIDSRREEIAEGCGKVVEVLRNPEGGN